MPTLPFGSYSISDDPARLDVRAMHGYLRRAYWSEEIPFEVVERAARGSLCIGLYEQFGFTALGNPERGMERLDPEVYKRSPR